MTGQRGSFFTVCRKTFRFLETEFSFRAPIIEQDRYGSLVLYQNATSFVQITDEPREGGVFVLIGRLVAGDVPEYPIEVGPDTELHAFYVEEFKQLRSKAGGSVPDSYLQQSVLERDAEDTRKYAADVLKGDFSVFPALTQQVRARLKQRD